MIRTVGIYLYAGLLVICTVFKLQRTKNRLKNHPATITDEEVFVTPKTVSRKVIEKTGTTVEVKGQEKLPEGAALFVANHQGLFDILALLGYLGKPIGFIAKKEIKKLPIISKWMELVYCVFIDRSDRRQSMKAINRGIDYLKAGHSIVIFPEGTRGEGREINEFKPGSFRLGLKSNVPIVPVTIDGTYQMLEGSNGRITPSAITLSIHDPIYPETYTDMKSGEVASKVQAIIENSLVEYDIDTKELEVVRT
ncbi:lysophospholipid acyltransferase family protein [Oceanobacillus bengalensis]|uniref:1-acyl-sn-glycerol-3-phosphate acyltransferase n=1 Tax=Oceanobacillus bengalensis TaxID=1435466 RepID=A0A494YW02_9BACI|nr:lysophospholipid acyltransferase family protein [Oceanobacillus bengalensis]RKQ14390.1 1-acyl-sn-glycerol-3-phosphate acyltransferase [Oceanobacillus bengalensis]